VAAGIALLRPGTGGTEVLLVHPGGPYWANKDIHGWSIPKGELDPGEDAASEADLATAARREFHEETGHRPPDGYMVALPELKLSSSKRLRAFAIRGDLDPDTITSNTFELEWPPRSGRTQLFPEVDRAAWFTLDEARERLHKGQQGLIDHLVGLGAEMADDEDDRCR
jgi:predicted NUDIX family NTP pyrophosphohydrolase